MMVLPCLFCVACAIAFSPGTREAPPPQKFEDIESAKQREEKESGLRSPTITPGVSIVVGGARIDAGALPPPPIPVAKPL